MIDLHLHIGLHKTGTTYLQMRLAENRAGLAALGARMPDEAPGETGHHHLWELLERDGPERLAETLRAAAGDARVLIVSSEQFGETLRRPGGATRLAAALAPHFRTRVHIRLRRQDALLESAYAESVKMFGAGPISDGPWYFFEHEARLRLLEDAFGREALRVSVHHETRRGDPFEDFLAACGLSLPDPVPPRAPEVNAAAGRRLTLFMSTVPKGNRAAVTSLLRIARNCGCIADDGVRALLPPAERRAFLEPHLAGNARLAERHGLAPADAAALTEPPPDEPGWFPAAPVTRAERLCVWRACMARMLGTRGSRSLGLAPALAVTRLIARSALTRA